MDTNGRGSSYTFHSTWPHTLQSVHERAMEETEDQNQVNPTPYKKG